MKSRDILLGYVSFLRFGVLFYQNAHWQNKGKSFYSNHLLFEKLYQELSQDLDDAAEKAIGLTDSSVLDLNVQLNMINKACEKICTFPIDYYIGFVEEGLKFEKLFGEYSSKMKERMGNEFSLGLEDMVMSHLSNSEKRVYLLKQNL